MTKKQQQWFSARRSVHIRKNAYDILSKHCKDNGYKMGPFIERKVIDVIRFEQIQQQPKKQL